MKGRTEILDYLMSALIGSAQTQVDMQTSENDLRVIYNLDFSAFFSGIWPETSKKSLYDAVSGEFYAELTSAKNLPYKPVITSLTMLEILESFYNRIEHAKSQRHELLDRVAAIHKNIQEIQSSPHSGNIKFPLKKIQMKQEIDKLYEISGSTLKGAVRNADNLLGDKGPVDGLGDVLGPSMSNIEFSQEKIDKLYDEMWKFRSARDQNSTIEQKEFRYMVDAINIYIQEELNRNSNSQQFLYVSKASYTSRFCPDFGRSPLVPLFWLKVSENKEFLNIREQMRFFASMENSASYAYDRFLARANVPEPDDYNYQLLASFNQQYMYLLDVIKEVDNYSFEEQDRFFTDKRYVAHTHDANIEKAENGLRHLFNDFGGVYSDDLIEQGGMKRLEHFRELLRKLRKLT